MKAYLDKDALEEISQQQGRVSKALLSDTMDIKLGDAVTNSNGKRLKAEHLKLIHAIFQHAITRKSGTVAIEAERLLIENK